MKKKRIDDSIGFKYQCQKHKKQKYVYMSEPPTPCSIPHEPDIEDLIQDFKKLCISEE